MDRKGLYGERAALYDPIYHWKDYVGEAQRLHELLSTGSQRQTA